VKIGASAAVYGGLNGIRSNHAVNLTNAGTIAVERFLSFGTAVDITANGNFTIKNTGLISGAVPAVIGIGIGIDIDGTGTHTITNSGTISGAIAIQSASGIEKVTNSGTMGGIVSLGDGSTGGDRIDLSQIDAISTNGAVINDSFNYLGLFAEFTKVAGQLRSIYNGNETIIEGDVNGDAKADFSIALTGRTLLIQGDDFFL
jgi:hypothetical protein